MEGLTTHQGELDNSPRGSLTFTEVKRNNSPREASLTEGRRNNSPREPCQLTEGKLNSSPRSLTLTKGKLDVH